MKTLIALLLFNTSAWAQNSSFIFNASCPSGIFDIASHSCYVANNGEIVVMTATGNIPVSQIFTIANCATACTLTLPSAALVYTATGYPVPQTNRYSIKNIGPGVPTVAASGSDLIDGAATAVLKFVYTNLDIVATNIGWNIL